jgi:SulP family sulfate permease
VREDTAELASYLLSDGATPRRPSFLQRNRAPVQDIFAQSSDGHQRTEDEAAASGTIIEVSEPVSPEEGDADTAAEELGPSVLSNLLKRSPPQSVVPDAPISAELRPHESEGRPPPRQDVEEDRVRPQLSEQTTAAAATEHTPLLGHVSDDSDNTGDIEGQKNMDQSRKWYRGFVENGQKLEGHVASVVKVAVNPHRWDREALWHNLVVEPVSCLPAVAVGLLLNILDALSYGKMRLSELKPPLGPVCS